MNEYTNKKDHIFSAVAGATAAGSAAAGSAAAGSAVAGSGDAIVAGVVSGVAVAIVTFDGEFKPYSALQGATMSLAIIFGTTAYNLNNKLDNLHANNTSVPDSGLVTNLKSIKPDVDLSTIALPRINTEAKSLLTQHYGEEANKFQEEATSKIGALNAKPAHIIQPT